MCLITKQKWPKIAWKPIKVYKVVYTGYNQLWFTTLYMGAVIKLGITYKTTLFDILRSRKKHVNQYKITVGLHSYTELSLAEAIFELDQCYKTKIIECEIPRFSLYWIGENYDSVSNKLKYVKTL